MSSHDQADAERRIAELQTEIETRMERVREATAVAVDRNEPLSDSEYWLRKDTDAKLTELRAELAQEQARLGDLNRQAQQEASDAAVRERLARFHPNAGGSMSTT